MTLDEELDDQTRLVEDLIEQNDENIDDAAPVECHDCPTSHSCEFFGQWHGRRACE